MLGVWLPARIVGDRGALDSDPPYVAAEQIRRGESMYEPHVPVPIVPGPYYVYPPPMAAALSLAPRVSHRAHTLAWLALSVVAYWILAAALARVAVGAWQLRPTLVSGALLFFLGPMRAALSMQNADVFVASLTAVAFAVPGLAGAALLAGALVKVPVLVLPVAVFALRGTVTQRAGIAAVACATALVMLAALGWAGSLEAAREYVDHVLSAFATGETAQLAGVMTHSFGPITLPDLWPENVSPAKAVARIVPGRDRWLLTMLSIGVPAGVAWLTRGRKVAAQGAAVLAAAVLSSPFVRPSYLLALLPVAVMWWQARRSFPGVPPRAAGEDGRGIALPGRA